MSDPQSSEQFPTEAAAAPSATSVAGSTADPTAEAPPTGGGRTGRPLFQLDQIRLARVILGIASLGVSIGYTTGSAGMPLGTPQQPGPGMWPLAVGGAWIVISLIVIFEAAFTKQVQGDLDLPHGIYRRDVIIFAVATVLYVVLLPWLGQYIAGSLYCVALVKFLSRLPWWKAVLYGLVMAIGISWIFLNLLQVRLPEGELLKALGI